MKKTLLICSVVLFGLGASAQVKKAAVQTQQPLGVSTSVSERTDKTSLKKTEAEKQAKIAAQLKLDADKARLQSSRSSKD